MINLTIPLSSEIIKSLRAGDEVNLSGIIYTARDAAHQRLKELIESNQPIPLDLNNAALYYAGPTETKPGQIIGSLGPTTSSRMDNFIDIMPQLGVKLMIGKGPRSQLVKNYCHNNNMLYLVACGGCGALISQSVIKYDIIAFTDLGCEAIRRLEIKDFKAIVAYDTNYNDLFMERNNDIK